MIYVAADHAGFELKGLILRELKEKNIPFIDLGAHHLIEGDDYSDYAVAVANAVKSNDLGILICGSGQGMAIAANKHKNTRAAQAWSVATAQSARHDDDANILCLAARLDNLDQPLDIVKAFLNTKFEDSKDRLRRLEKIDRLERD